MSDLAEKTSGKTKRSTVDPVDPNTKLFLIPLKDVSPTLKKTILDPAKRWQIC